MDDLSESICNAVSLPQIELLLYEAMAHVEVIGELPITLEAFRAIGAILRRTCLSGNQLLHVSDYPATFVSSMVFSGRYSHDENMQFWDTYAQDVWGLKSSRQDFQHACQQHARDAIQGLTAQFGFDFSTHQDGDITHAIYQHAIIPAYLESVFLYWLRQHLFHFHQMSYQSLSEFIKAHQQAQHIIHPLRHFLTGKNTYDLAMSLTYNLLTGVSMRSSHMTSGEIRAIFPNRILRDLWDKLLAELDDVPVVVSPHKPATKLEWVWSLRDHDWVLQLSHLITESYHKPMRCIWSCASRDEALSNYDYQVDVWAEEQASGHWRIRKLELGTAHTPHMLYGTVYIYDDQQLCIFEQAVPPLPNQPFQFYHVNQHRTSAELTTWQQLTEGDWLVSYNGNFQMRDVNQQVMSPIKSIKTASPLMTEQVGHTQLATFQIRLPITIETHNTRYHITPTRSRLLKQPVLKSAYHVPDTSDRLPPVYTSNQICLKFDEIPIHDDHLWIHLVTPWGELYKPFKDYVISDEKHDWIDLSQLLPDDQIGTYTIDITYGFQSRLVAPIELSILPDLEISRLEATVYHPLKPPCIRIKKLTNHTIKSPQSATVIESTADEWVITWHDLRSPYCRLTVHQANQVVSVEWQVERVYAWFEKSTLPDCLLIEDLTTASIRFQGQPDQSLVLLVNEAIYPFELDANGQKTFDLGRDSFSDLLRLASGRVVPLELLLDDERWLIGSFVRHPQIVSLQAEYLVNEHREGLMIDASLSDEWETTFEIRLIDVQNQHIVYQTQTASLRNRLFDVRLPIGTYRIELWVDNDRLHIPENQIIEIKAPTAIIEANYDEDSGLLQVAYIIDFIKLGNYTLKVLTASGHEVLTTPINITQQELTTVIHPRPEIAHTVQIQWNYHVIGRSSPFFVTTKSTQASQTPLTVYQLGDGNNATWLDYLVRHPKDKLDQDTLLALATIDARSLHPYQIESLRQLWRPVARLAEVHRPQHWKTHYGLLPTWCLMDRALSMKTKHGTSYWIYPESILHRGLTGIGQIILDTPQEGIITGYARWSMRHTPHQSRLHVWIPPHDPGDGIFSQLDELDMWPAYYDLLSGRFHGARTHAMLPVHNEAENTHLVDSSYIYTLLVEVNHTSQPLKHVLPIDKTIERQFIHTILNGRNGWRTRPRDAEQITSVTGYRYVNLAWIQNYLHSTSKRKHLEALADKTGQAQKLSDFIPKIASLYQQTNTTLLSGAMRLLTAMEDQVHTGDHPLMNLDRHLLVLAIILRAYSLESRSTRQRILQSVDIDELQLARLLTSANNACPELLEWALTWAEIFIVHGTH